MRCNKHRHNVDDFLQNNGHCVFAYYSGSGLAQEAKRVIFGGIVDIEWFCLLHMCWEIGRLLQISFITGRFSSPVVLLALPVIYRKWNVFHWFPWYKLNLKSYEVLIFAQKVAMTQMNLGCFRCCSLIFSGFGSKYSCTFLHFLCIFYALFMHFLCTFYALFMHFLCTFYALFMRF